MNSFSDKLASQWTQMERAMQSANSDPELPF
jgi:hypothetical protein